MADSAGSSYAVRASSGSLRAPEGEGMVVLPHAWTPEGVVAGPAGNGAQLLHLAVALCVLNDVYREARDQDVVVAGVVVEADGGFDASWASTGITYRVDVDSPTGTAAVHRLLAWVDEVAEIPQALRAGAKVRRG
jgi:hypothetical protein